MNEQEKREHLLNLALQPEVAGEYLFPEFVYWEPHDRTSHPMLKLKAEYLKEALGGKLRFFAVSFIRVPDGNGNRMLIAFDQTEGSGAPTIPVEAFMELSQIVEKWNERK